MSPSKVSSGTRRAVREDEVIKVRLRDGGAFLDRYGLRDGNDEVFLAEALERQVGDEIKLDLYFDHSGFAFRVGGRVVSRRLSRAGELAPGARVALDPEDLTIRSMILSHARGEDIDYRARSDERARCKLPIRVASPVQARGTVVDLSTGGARVCGIFPPDLGVLLELKLAVPGALLGFPLSGRVVWRRPEAEPLMGVAFELESARAERRLRDLVARLRADPKPRRR